MKNQKSRFHIFQSCEKQKVLLSFSRSQRLRTLANLTFFEKTTTELFVFHYFEKCEIYIFLYFLYLFHFIFHACMRMIWISSHFVWILSEILKYQHLTSKNMYVENHPMKKKVSKLKQHFQKLTPSEVCTSRVQELAEMEPDVHLSKLIILGVRLTETFGLVVHLQISTHQLKTQSM